jgi:hypothetical protein
MEPTIVAAPLIPDAPETTRTESSKTHAAPETARGILRETEGMCQLRHSHSQTPSWFLVSCDTLMGWWQTNYRPFLIHSLPGDSAGFNFPNPNLQGKYIPEPRQTNLTSNL